MAFFLIRTVFVLRCFKHILYTTPNSKKIRGRFKLNERQCQLMFARLKIILLIAVFECLWCLSLIGV